jgi:hypothetical protein
MSESCATFLYGYKLKDDFRPDFEELAEREGWDADGADPWEAVKAAGGELVVEDHCSCRGLFVSLPEYTNRTDPWSSVRLSIDLSVDTNKLWGVIRKLALEEHIADGPGWFLVCEYEGT